MPDIEKQKIEFNCVEPHNVKPFSLSWSANLGFGTFHVEQDIYSGKLRIISEMMSRDAIKAAFAKLIDASVLTDFERLDSQESTLTIEELNAFKICGNAAKRIINYPMLITDSLNNPIEVRDVFSEENRCIRVELTQQAVDLINKEDYYLFCDLVHREGFSKNWVKQAKLIKFEVVKKQ